MTEDTVEHTLSGRLRIGGKWMGRGDKVRLTKEEAIVYESRGLSRPTVPEPEKKKEVDTTTATTAGPPDEVEKIPASQVGVITKKMEPERHGKSRDKNR